MEQNFDAIFIALTIIWVLIILITVHTIMFEKMICKKIYEQTGYKKSFWKSFYRKWGIWIFDNIKLMEKYNDMREDFIKMLDNNLSSR